jgi:hypothetical protein
MRERDDLQSEWFRVEDESGSGLAGFHRIGNGILAATLADLFRQFDEARFFAGQCQQQFPAARVVVIRFTWWPDEAGRIYSKKEMVWRVK